MYKIGVLYICTGKYDVFWKDFYKSSEENFLKGNEINYFVFTDSEKIYGEGENPRIHKIFQENIGWPNNTLKRFEIFKKAEFALKKMDFLFFFNANLLFLKKVGEEILPIHENLLVVKHPGFYNKSNKEFTYDRNKKSLAYIGKGKGKYYVAGGLNGGKTSAFLELINTLDKNIQSDLRKNIIAIWHDESHINRYILERNDYKILEPSYLYPEGWDIPFEPIILIRDKNKYGGHNNLRGETQLSLVERVVSKAKSIVKLLIKRG